MYRANNIDDNISPCQTPAEMKNQQVYIHSTEHIWVSICPSVTSARKYSFEAELENKMRNVNAGKQLFVSGQY